MRRRWFPVLVLFFLALLGVWFWSLGTLPDAEETAIVLQDIQHPVEVQQNGQGTWEKASVGQRVSVGDRIRVGSHGHVVVRWDGLGETEIAEGTELLLETDKAIQESDERFMKIRVEAGRVWTRLLRLVDLDAGFIVETPEVVATVRGTSFDVKTGQGSTEVWVSDSAVDVEGDRASLIIPEGRSAFFRHGEAPTSTQRVDVFGADDWRKGNLEHDKQFFTRTSEAVRKQIGFERMPKSRTLQRLSILSESLHARFAKGDARDRLRALYIVRRLALARRTAEEGRSGLAYQEWARFEAEMKGQLQREDGAAWRRVFRFALSAGLRLYADVMPETPAYRLKQDLEDARMLIADSIAERLAVQIAIVDARVTEGRAALQKGALAQARLMTTVAEQGLENAKRESENGDLTEQQRKVLRRKAAALLARIEALSADVVLVEEAARIPVEVLPETATTTATTTVPIADETSTPVVVPQAPRAVQLSVTPAQATVAWFGQVAFTVQATMSDGRVLDVTSSSKISLSDLAKGSIVRGVFTAGQSAGNVHLTATYVDGGTTLTAGADIMIIER